MKMADLVIGIGAGILLAAYSVSAQGAAQLTDIPIDSPQPQIAYGQQVASNDYYDAYYDGGYGTYTDGYWGTDGQYWYENGTASYFTPDTAHHFRRTPGRGYALVRGSGVQRQN